MSRHTYSNTHLITILGSVLLSLWMMMLGIQSTWAASAPPPPVRRPNIVLIFADDMGYGDLGSYGARGYKTPNLDRLAKEGTRFTSFYVSSPVCSASRASLLSGCYHSRVGIHGAMGPKSKQVLSTNETTMAAMLKDAGYATALFGKWHLGDHPDYLPLRHGFDEYFGLPYSNDMWPNHPTAKDGAYPLLPLIEGNRVVQRMPDQRELTTWYTERAVDFIERNQSRPFFLYLAHSMPHVPLFASGKFEGTTRRGIYGDVISEIDWSVGQVMEALRRAGLEQDTWVIFTSDNGPWHSYGDHAGSAGPLREGKASVFEGGIRVPCIMRWPGKIPSHRVSDEPLMTIDLLPTVAVQTGSEVPGRVIDGKNVWPVLAGVKGATTPHEAYFFYYGENELQAVRSGRWKLHLPHKAAAMQGQMQGGGGRPGKYFQLNVRLELYDLEQDIGEVRDVSLKNPDVVKRLLAHVENARDELGDSLTRRVGRGVRPAATPREEIVATPKAE